MHAIPHRYPMLMIDRVVDVVLDQSAVGVKNVSVNEHFFQGHFPGHPVMPGVLIIESMAQTAAVLVVETLGGDAAGKLVYFMTIESAKFRRPVVPGDQLRLLVVEGAAPRQCVEVPRHRDGRRRVRGGGDVRRDDHGPPAARSNAQRNNACVGGCGDAVAWSRRLRGLTYVACRPPGCPALTIHPTAIVAAAPRIAPDATHRPLVHGRPGCRDRRRRHLVSHVVVDGHTRIGAGAVLYPFCTVGLAPQDLKYKGEPTRCEIGPRTQVREHCTIHRGTVTGTGVTRVGADCLLMAVVHVAHDCELGDGVIIANNVVMGGHVEIGDGAVIGGAAALHQFVRIGRAAMVGGVSGVEADVVPFGSVIGNRARLAGLNVDRAAPPRRGQGRLHTIRDRLPHAVRRRRRVRAAAGGRPAALCGRAAGHGDAGLRDASQQARPDPHRARGRKTTAA